MSSSFLFMTLFEKGSLLDPAAHSLTRLVEQSAPGILLFLLTSGMTVTVLGPNSCPDICVASLLSTELSSHLLRMNL